MDAFERNWMRREAAKGMEKKLAAELDKSITNALGVTTATCWEQPRITAETLKKAYKMMKPVTPLPRIQVSEYAVTRHLVPRRPTTREFIKCYAWIDPTYWLQRYRGKTPEQFFGNVFNETISRPAAYLIKDIFSLHNKNAEVLVIHPALYRQLAKPKATK